MLIEEIEIQTPAYVRVIVAMFFSFGTTLLLVWGMEKLISTDPLEPPTIVDRPNIDVVLIEKDIEIHHEKPPEKIEAPKELPDLPDMLLLDIDTNLARGGVVFEYIPTNDVGEVGVITQEGAPIAQVMLAPTYPSRASSRGVEGFVDVVFDITEYGATENIRILQAQPPSYFERAAERAVERWKFSPHTVNGKNIPYKNMRHRIQFQLENS